jgi:hypothetical protein
MQLYIELRRRDDPIRCDVRRDRVGIRHERTQGLKVHDHVPLSGSELTDMQIQP